MKLEMMSKTNRFISRAGLKLKKHSPDILMVAGIAGTIASTVMACKATTKATALLEESKKEIAAIHHVAENNDEYSERDLLQFLQLLLL